MIRRGLVVRLLLIGALLLALYPPALPGPGTPVTVLALVDESHSMPAGFADAAWRQLYALRESLPRGSSIDLMRFAAALAVEDPAPELPRSAPLDGSATDLGLALRGALYRLPAEGAAAVVLLSDGGATRGDPERSLVALREAGVPVYLWAPEDRPAAGPRLQSLWAPERVRAGGTFPVRLTVAGPAGATARLLLSLDGVEVARRELVPGPDGAAVAALTLAAGDPGERLLTARLAGSRGDPGRSAVVNVRGRGPVLYIATDPAPPVWLRGPEMVTLAPEEFAARRDLLRTAGAVVLDNLAVTDLPQAAWDGLADAVRGDGVGLLVAGGGRSFGAGAYRHSTLEQLLPVTAEAAQPQPRAAVLFLLDKSGSMGDSSAGATRFAQGRRAVAEAAAQLLPQDLLGITAFAGDVDLRFPIGPAPADPLEALRIAPGGNTRMGPALLSAAAQLEAVEASERLLVLVTDGFAGDDDLAAARRDLRAAGITVIALAVGPDPDLDTLGRLTDFNHGRVLRVGDIAQLPRLMASELADRRAPAVAGPGPTLTVAAPPFFPEPVAWPGVSGYMVTRLREGGSLLLASAAGDPLLATGTAGAGRVAVLPAGSRAWTAGEGDRAMRDRFLAALLDWLARGRDDSRCWLELEHRDEGLRFTLDQCPAAAGSGASPRLLLRDPDGSRREVPLQLQAPDLYVGTAQTALSGRYLAIARGAFGSTRLGYYLDPADDLVDPVSLAQRRSSWLQRELLRPWPGGRVWLEELPRAEVSARGWLVAAALLSFLLLLAAERGLLSAPFRRQKP